MSIKCALSVLSATLCLAAVSAQASTIAIPTETPWRFNVAPYLWALSMNGTVAVRTRAAHVDQSFSDIWQKMEWGGMVWLEADKDKWGIFLNSLYAVLSDDAHQGPFSVNAKVNYGIFGGGVSYEVYKCLISNTSYYTVEPYAGFRYTLNDTRLTFNANQFSDQKSLNKSWTDPIIGVRLNYAITKAWKLFLAGDIGGKNASSQYSYGATGLVGYSPQTVMKNSTIFLGYRILDQRYQTGGGSTFYNWNMKLAGPMAGVNLSF